jgi:hypothetical protein
MHRIISSEADGQQMHQAISPGIAELVGEGMCRLHPICAILTTMATQGLREQAKMMGVFDSAQPFS